MRRVLLSALIFLAGISAAVAAEPPLRLDGPLAQGGLVVGTTLAGGRVSLDGRPVRVSPDGMFLIGFGRDAGLEAILRITGPDGGVLTRRLAIAPGDYPIARVDGLPPAKVTPSAEDMVRIRADEALIRDARRRDSPETWFREGLIWPVSGRISGVFGSQRILNGEPRNPHSGTDVAAPEGTPVHASATGIVTVAEDDMFFTGKTVMIDHGHGLASVYAHMSAIAVRVGDLVRQDQPIGAVGASGRASGPHLHWGLSLFDLRLDPALSAGPMTTR